MPIVRHGKTIKARRNLHRELSEKFEFWISLSDSDLMLEVQKVFPVVTEATRDEMLKFLTMEHTALMVGD